MAHQWVHMTPDSLIPPLAVIGEPNWDNSPTAYVGRSSHEGGTFPARVVSNEHCAYISWAGSQIKKTDYELLVGENYKFIEYAADGIPLRAVRAGNTAQGEPLYVGRGVLAGNKIVGKIHPIHQCMFVAFGGREHRIDSYEVLVRGPPSNAAVPVVMDVDKNDESRRLLFSGKDNLPTTDDIAADAGKTNADLVDEPQPQLSTAENSKYEIKKSVVDEPTTDDPATDEDNANKVLVDEPQSSTAENSKYEMEDPVSEPTTDEQDEDNANEDLVYEQQPTPSTAENSKYEMEKPVVDEPTTDDSALDEDNANEVLVVHPEPFTAANSMYEMNEPFYKSVHLRDISSDEHAWVSVPFSGIPPNAVIAGKDTNGSVVYVGRATNHENMKVPAKIIPARNIASYSELGAEVKVDAFEVLVGDGYCWVKPPISRNNIPIGAVSTGRDKSGNLFFIGRGHFGGALTPGRVRKWCSSVRIPFDGKDIIIDNDYEILVKK